MSRVIELTSLSSGTLYGPSSAVDNQMLKFDGTTGHLVQAAQLTYLGDDGSMSLGQASAPETLLELTSTAPYITLHNSTEEDTDEGRESIIWFSGEQSGGEETHLGAIKCFHDGSDDDQKGAIVFYTNDGTDDDAPTERMRIDSNGYVGIGSSPDSDYQLTVKNKGMYTNCTLIDPSDTTNINYFKPVLQCTENNANLVRGTSYQLNYSGSSVGDHTGTIFSVGNSGYNSSTRTLNLFCGLVASVGNLAAGTITTGSCVRGNFYGTAGTIINAKTFLIDSPTGAGAITNLYGLYIDDMSAGTTLNYAIYSNGGQCYFKDNVGIGVIDPDAKVEIFSTSTQLKLSYDATNYVTFLTGADGDTTITTVDADGAAGDINLVPDGIVSVEANIYPATDDTYYLGKNDGVTTLAWKGLILVDTTDSNYYRIEVINGVVTATQINLAGGGVDSENKRRAASGFFLFLIPPVPDEDIDNADDRYHNAGFYQEF